MESSGKEKSFEVERRGPDREKIMFDFLLVFSILIIIKGGAA